LKNIVFTFDATRRRVALMPTFTERLRDAAGKTWQDVVKHPFTGAERAGTD